MHSNDRQVMIWLHFKNGLNIDWYLLPVIDWMYENDITIPEIIISVHIVLPYDKNLA